MSPDTHYGSYAGPMRADIDDAATMCKLTATLNSVINTRGSVCFMNFGRHPDAHLESLKIFNDIYAYERPAGGLADIAICGVFAPTDHLFFHTGWGCMSSDLVLKDGATIIYCSPSPGVNTHLGNFPGLALMDLMKPYMPPTPENMECVYRDIHARKIEMWAGCIWVPIYEVMTRKKLHVVTLEENLEMAADIGIEASTSLENALADAFTEHGKDAKVVVLPYARYQMPRDAIVMPGQEKPQYAAVAE
jgi:nickel-dependent lactate racemase